MNRPREPSTTRSRCSSWTSDKAGQGVGKASIYTKITETKDGTIELENFANQPVMLNEVRKVQ